MRLFCLLILHDGFLQLHALRLCVMDIYIYIYISHNSATPLIIVIFFIPETVSKFSWRMLFLIWGPNTAPVLFGENSYVLVSDSV